MTPSFSPLCLPASREGRLSGGLGFYMTMDTLNILTKAKYELIDITSKIRDVVSKTQIQSGLAVVFIPHTTAGIICNEDEANLKSDVLKVLAALEQNPKFFGGFEHDRGEMGNAHAHIISSICGNSRTFVVENSELKLGTWQSVMLLEMDGPRERHIWVKLVPDPLS